MSGDQTAGGKFAAAAGRDFVARAFTAAGLPPEDAAAVAERIIRADLRGIGSHGITRLAPYVERVRQGGINPRPKRRIVTETAATALIDGDNGMGHLVMGEAAQLAMAKAAASGVGWVGARGSNHAGAAAVYAMMPLAQDMIGLYFAVADINHMAPWGGLEPLLGTNPIAVAVPTLEEPPVVLDIATTATSFGKVRVAALNGEMLEPGMMMDHSGQPLTDPKRAGEGLLLPMGGYKGFGLSLIISLLAGALNGTPVGRDAVTRPRSDNDASNTGQAVMAINVASFGGVEGFKRYVDRIVGDIRRSKPLPGRGEVRYPGLAGHRTMVARERDGIPIRPPQRAILDELAGRLGIAPLALL